MYDILTHPYILIGALIYVVGFKKMARGFANTSGRFLVTYDMEGPNNPRIIDYVATLIWGPFVIGAWPLFLFLYLER